MAADLLTPILERKRREIARRLRHGRTSALAFEDRASRAIAALRRNGEALPRVIAEIKFESPSEGPIRPWSAGEARRIAAGYVRGGAAAVSVLCDRVGFGGSVLELRRVARAIERPVLFKEFVLDPIQIDLAFACGASMVLLLVRALTDEELISCVRICSERGLAPLVEAADEHELERAVATDAPIIGINARDLTTFRVRPDLAALAIDKIPENRVAVYMSGVSSVEELSRVAQGRADAVLIGSALMRARDPGGHLAHLLSAAGTR